MEYHEILGGIYCKNRKPEKWLTAIKESALALLAIATLFALAYGIIAGLICSTCLYHGYKIF